MAITPDYYVYSGTAQDDSDSTWNSSTISHPSLDALYTNETVATGDVVAVAHDHSHDYGGTANQLVTLDDVDHSVICVNRSTGVQTSGAVEKNGTTSGNNNLTLQLAADGNKTIKITGIEFATEKVLIFNSFNNYLILEDCKLNSYNTAFNNPALISGGDGNRTDFINCVFEKGGAATSLSILDLGVSFYRFFDCSLVSGSGDHLISAEGSGGRVFEFYGGDFSALTGELMLAPASTGDTTVIKAYGTLMPSAGIVEASGEENCVFVDAWHCGLNNRYYGFFNKQADIGECEDDPTVSYISSTYDGTNEFSFAVSTLTECSPLSPYRFKAAEFADIDLTSSKTLTCEFTAATASLTDNDVWLEVEVNNTTNLAERDLISYQNADPMATGTAVPTAGTSTWAGTTGSLGNDYKITETVAAVTGASNANVVVWVCCGKASFDFNFDFPALA